MTDEEWMHRTAEIAKNSLCLKAKCGSIVVSEEEIIGTGFNSPAGDEPNRCLDEYSIPESNKHDITCCVHAEVRAIHDAIRNNPAKLNNATVYFTRINSDGTIHYSGTPYCTICSREALDSGIKKFVLWHKDGIKVYDTEEYNNLTYQYFKDKNLWHLK